MTGDDRHLDPDVVERTLKSFIVDGRIKTIPAKRSRRIIIARWLAQRFDREVAYTEREVNAIVQAHHADFATLRREMVDHGFLVRTDGIYRRPAAIPEVVPAPTARARATGARPARSRR